MRVTGLYGCWSRQPIVRPDFVREIYVMTYLNFESNATGFRVKDTSNRAFLGIFYFQNITRLLGY